MKHWNEARANDPVDCQIEASLRRQFVAPELQFQAPSGGGDLTFRERVFSEWRRVTVAALVIAACSAALFTWNSNELASDGVEVASVDRSGARADGQAPSGAPVVSITEHSDPERPNIAGLYEEILSIPQPVAECNLASAEITDGVQRTFSSRCGATIELEEHTASMLEGPFFSEEWPSGTMLAGYPDGPDQPPVVIVAECADFQDCCIDLAASSQVGLQHFSTLVGGVMLTEITPYAEPRMLAALASR